MSQNPTTKHPTPPFETQQQTPPGHTSTLSPQLDHAETSFQGSGRLAGKVALITGADSGIGRAVAITFAREGADVAISYLNEDEDAEETAHWVREAGRRSLSLPGDISEAAHCRAIVEQTASELGKIDILVNNAAMQRTHDDIGDINDEEWELTFRTNIHAMFYLCKAALPRMQPGGLSSLRHRSMRITRAQPVLPTPPPRARLRISPLASRSWS
jgi:NAD(P)-dependent dehydrogenase (short-subunit alcohol dehydrogenase family)